MINAIVGVTQAWGTIFGEKPLLDAEYVDTSIALAEYSEPGTNEPAKRTGLVRPYGCRIAANELRHGYLATQTERPSSPHPLRYSDGSDASPEDRVLYLVIRNESGFAREVRLVGTRMEAPVDLTETTPGQQERGRATLDGLVGAFDIQLGDDAPKPVEVPLGSLRAKECVAIAVAVYQAAANADGEQLLSVPVYRFHTLQYRRAFGWIGESQSIRPPNAVPLTITPVTGGRG
jgi:hypothetical protein